MSKCTCPNASVNFINEFIAHICKSIYPRKKYMIHSCTLGCGYLCVLFFVSSHRNYWLGFKNNFSCTSIVITNITFYRLIQKFVRFLRARVYVCLCVPSGIYYKMPVHIKLNAFRKNHVISFYIFQFLSCFIVMFCLCWL